MGGTRRRLTWLLPTGEPRVAASPEPIPVTGHNWLFCLIRGSSAGESGRVAAEGEEGEGDEWFVAVEPEGDAGEEPDLGVGRFDEGVGEAVFEGGVDGVAMRGDLAVQIDEGREL